MKISLRFWVGLGLISLSGWASADELQARSWAASCANCHGTNGIAQEGMESLAGRTKEELVRKMMEYKNGKRPGTVMPQLAKGYSDDQIDKLSAYFAALKK